MASAQAPTIVDTEIWGSPASGILFQETDIRGLISGCDIRDCTGFGIQTAPKVASAGALVVTNTVHGLKVKEGGTASSSPATRS